MNQPDVYSFKNSDSCEGIGVVGDESFSHDIIAISGRYPEGDSWARNREAREQVIIVRGIGELALRGGVTVDLDATNAEKRAVVVEAGEWFARNGDMTISMVCQPGFDPEKYDIKTESEVALIDVVEQYFPEDKEFIQELDFDSALGFVYGQLLEQGEDPDEILREMGVTE